MELITKSQQKMLKENGYWEKLTTGEEVAFLPGNGTALFIYHYHFEVIPDSMENYKKVIIWMLREYEYTNDVYTWEVHCYEQLRKSYPDILLQTAYSIIDAVESIIINRAIDEESYKHD